MFIGVDIGGTTISAGLFDANKRLVATAKVSSKGKSETSVVLGQVFKVIDELLDDEKRTLLKAIGIGIAGFVDSKLGIVKFSANVNLNGVNVVDKVSQKFKVPVFVENDVNVGVIGEWKHGVGKGYKNIVGIFVGTGIGGGLIINDEFIYGESGGAGAVGHITINSDGPYCQSCGSQGCVEAYAGKVGIENTVRYLSKKNIKSELIDLVSVNHGKLEGIHLKKALEVKDKVAIDIINNAMTHLGIAVANYVNLLNPSLILFGGGLMSAIGQESLELIREACSKYAFKSMIDICEFKIATLGDNSGTFGAMEIAVDRLKEQEKCL